jgi:hypothetical protein
MTRRYLPAAIALLLAAPAAASPQQDSACLIGRLSAADASAITADLLEGRSEPVIDRLAAGMEACSGEQNWAPSRRGDAAAYALGRVTRDTLHPRLVAQGIDPSALDRWFARQSLEFRTTAFATMAQADLEAGLATLIGNEVSIDQMERGGTAIGGYLSALMIIERVERGLGM